MPEKKEPSSNGSKCIVFKIRSNTISILNNIDSGVLPDDHLTKSRLEQVLRLLKTLIEQPRDIPDEAILACSDTTERDQLHIACLKCGV